MTSAMEIHGIRLELEDDDPPVIRKGVERGWYEKNEVDSVRRILRGDDRVIELGAGLGVVTCAIAGIVGSRNVLAFEPNPAIAARARSTLHGNGFDVTVREEVCKPRKLDEKSAEFWISEVFWASGLQRKAASARRIVAPVRPLEDVIDGLGATILVMDIEGGEVEILLNMDLAPLRAIVLETHDDFVGRRSTNEAIRSALDQGFLIDFKNAAGGVITLMRE
jgi:FkbM family methyltransferase